MAVERVLKGPVAPTPVAVVDAPAATVPLPPDASLPAVMQEIASVVGIDAAWLLVRAKGGTTITLPRAPGAAHWLSKLLGLDVARRLCAHFRANHQLAITVPMASAAQKAARWDEAIGAGLSIAQTALQLGVHKATVSRQRQRRAGNRPSSQGELF